MTHHTTESMLREHLIAAARCVHARPALVTSDPELLAFLADLYDVPPSRVWDAHLGPFIEKRRPALRHLFDEHAVWPHARLLDLGEVLLVLERLENDRLRLLRGWPLSLSSLDELASAWGTPLPAVS